PGRQRAAQRRAQGSRQPGARRRPRRGPPALQRGQMVRVEPRPHNDIHRRVRVPHRGGNAVPGCEVRTRPPRAGDRVVDSAVQPGVDERAVAMPAEARALQLAGLLKRFGDMTAVDGCLACGRTGEAVRPARPPGWAWLAAWVAVAGWLARVLAQVAVGFGSGPLRAGGSLLLFEAGFLLAGAGVPLALVYRVGRGGSGGGRAVAGRGVPRWLVLGPALGLAVGMTAYFGVAAVQLAAETVTGTWEQGAGSLPLGFFWVAIPAYLAWGSGLGAAALAYRRATRRPCRTCGR